MKNHTIWSNINLDLDDWREDLLENLRENGCSDKITDDDLYNEMVEANENYLYDERANLNIQKSQPIIVIADLGLWNGRHQAYKMIESGNIRDCLFSNTDYTEWYVDEDGDFRADAIHHDGTNHYLYRVIKRNATEEQIEDLQYKLYEGVATTEDIATVTNRLGNDIAKVYGWKLND